MKLDIRLGDCLDVLPRLPAGSVQMCVTSPPYWQQRDYHVSGQLGLEDTPEIYVAKMVEVFRAVRRVLRSDATLWLNLGSSYSSGDRSTFRSGASQNKGHDIQNDLPRPPTPPGFKPKDLIPIPWMVAMALQADGWYLRSDIIWAKSNPMPESCTDRPTKSHEYLFLLTKSAKYFYDADAIREPSIYAGDVKVQGEKSLSKGQANGRGVAKSGNANRDTVTVGQYRNKRSVWTIPEEEWAQFLEWRAQQVEQKPDVWQIATQAFSKAHFATFPEALVLPCILAGTSEEGCCAECGAPLERVVERTAYTPEVVAVGERFVDESRCDKTRKLSGSDYNKQVTSTTTGWEPSCKCDADTVPCTVLDPFLGSGTTAKVSQQYGRSFVGCELSPEYLELARDRFNQPRLFA